MSRGRAYIPFIAAEHSLPELTVRAIVLGIVLSIFFGVGNAFVGLKVGMTVSASIPASVMSMGILRLFFKRVSILENNMVQTIASAGEALAAGIIFTIPALFFLGEPISILKTFLLSILGGFLGVFFMLPLREQFVVKEHGVLLFPEGTACAEILKAGEMGPQKAILAIVGVVVGTIYRCFIGLFHLWPEVITWKFKQFQKSLISFDTTPALLGVGFIIGPKIAATMMSGGVLAWWVLMPLLKLFGQGSIVIPPATEAISLMTDTDIWSNYVRYIGAGGVTVGGLFALFRILPSIAQLFNVKHLKKIMSKAHTDSLSRTDKVLPMQMALIGSGIILICLWMIPYLHLNWLSVLLILVLGFFFVAVTCMTVGIVGSSSNPVSGIIIMTLLITLVLFLSLGWTERFYMIAATMVSCVVAIAICIASDTSQDLKTGFLVGATPIKQQIGMMIGIVSSGAFIGITLILLNKAYTLGSATLSAPQATIISLIVKGFIQGNLPFQLIIVGLLMGVAVELMGIHALAFSLGLYFPLGTTVALFMGGVVSYLAHLKIKEEGMAEKGVLLASGLVAGDALTGVFIALLAVMGFVNVTAKSILPQSVGFIAYVGLGVFLWYLAVKKGKDEN